MRKTKQAKKVIVAMSGGIDSSVAAALLKKTGFDVVGVFMILVDLPRFRQGAKRAKKIAKILNIPFYVFDFKKEFKKRIINYFLVEYKTGRTPNPCVVCNKEIKFKFLFNQLSLFKADFFATGHYVKKSKISDRSRESSDKNQKSKIIYKLLKAKDKEKDQSYFLWKLNQEMLKHILFPIGDYTKPQVRKLAEKFKLPLGGIPESQEICFIQTTINDFLGEYLKSKPGKIVDTKEKIVGRHYGLYFYTIGQRKGIKLSGGPYYVLDKNLKKNTLIVTKNEKDLYKKELIAKNVNWIVGKTPKFPLKVRAKIRYRYGPASAVIKKHNNGKIKVIFSKPQRAITPGQSVVFYKGQEVLGGGIIS